MEKVKITQEIADCIEVAREHCTTDIKTLKFILYSASDNNLKLEIPLVNLARAIEEGYEVIREFKVGDIVRRFGGPLDIVEKTNNSLGQTTLKTMEEKGIENYTLLCKAENREDREDKQNDK